MSAASPSEQLSTTELTILRLLVYVHPATLSTEYLRHRLGMHVLPQQEAECLASRGFVELAICQNGRVEEWRATRAGMALEERIAKERPLADRGPMGCHRPRSFDHLCPPSCSG
jgi:hypothetical protein